MKKGTAYTEEWIEMNEDRISSFLKSSGDNQWIHFGRDAIVPGMLILSIGITPLTFVTCKKMMIVKIDQCKFRFVVRVGQSICRIINVIDIQDVDDDCKSLRVHVSIQEQDTKKIACQFEATFYYYV
jgi:hypothetical protein